MRRFIEELHKRNVLKVASVYALTAWVVVQVAETTFPYLKIPANLVTGIIIMALLLFPVCLIISWKYEIIPDQKIRASHGDATGNSQGVSRPDWLYWIILIGPPLLGISLLVWVSFAWLGNMNEHRLVELRNTPIAVSEFVNETGDSTQNFIGKIAQEMISMALQSSGEAKIIPSGLLVMRDENLKFQKSEFGYSTRFSETTGAENLIDGRFFKVGGGFVILCHIIEIQTGYQIKSFEVHWDNDEQIVSAITSLAQQILGYWISQDDPLFQNRSPSADAYEEYYKAIENWERDYDLVFKHLEKCIRLDSTFVRAYLLQIEAYMNRYAAYEEADSLIERLEAKGLPLYKAEEDLLQYYKARVNGNLRLAYEYFMKEYDRAPRELFVNYSALSEALMAANRPWQVLQIARKIKDKNISYERCSYCLQRLEMIVAANVELNNNRKALKLIQNHASDPVSSQLKQFELRILAKQGKMAEMESLLSQSRLQRFTDQRDFKYFHFIATHEMAMAGYEEFAGKLATMTLSLLTDTTEIRTYSLRARTYLVIGEYESAEQELILLINKLNRQGGSYWMYFYRSKLGVALGRQGKTDQAMEIIDELEQLKNPYDQGKYSYFQGQIYASMGDRENMLKMLKEAIAKGEVYGPYSYHNDFEFREYADRRDFKEAVRIDF